MCPSQEKKAMAATPCKGQHWPKQNATVPSQHESEFALAKHFINALCQSTRVVRNAVWIQESCLRITSITVDGRVDAFHVSSMQSREQAGTAKGVRQVLYTGGSEPKNRSRFDDGDRFQHVGGLGEALRIGCRKSG
jgi:hypothetical protein